jgi:hypothetical protein
MRQIIMEDFEHLRPKIRGLKAMIHNNQAKIGAGIKGIQDGQEEIRCGKVEMEATVSTILKKMRSWQEDNRTCLVEVEVTDLEANPEEKETAAEQQEVPKKGTTVKTVTALKKEYGDWHLATWCH